MELDYFDEPNEIYLSKTQENNWKNHETTQKESSTINLRLGGGKIVFHTSTYGGEAIFFFDPQAGGGQKIFTCSKALIFFRHFMVYATIKILRLKQEGVTSKLNIQRVWPNLRSTLKVGKFR